MKKIIATLALVMILASVFTTSVFAGPNGIIENPPINVPAMTPTIDGIINENEGWSVSALMNYDTLGFYWHVNPLTMDGNVRFAWDDTYLYYCANIVDGLETHHEITGELIPAGYNSFIYSTGEDDIDVGEDGSGYGYNGDIFCLLIDPMGVMQNELGYVGNEDYTPWYLIGLFEGDVAKMYREQTSPGEITDQVQVAGHKTADGWQFEAALPWEMVIKDIDDITYGESSSILTKEALLSEGSLVRVGAMYHDRFYDPEADEISTWGRFTTCPTTLATGMHGQGSSGDNVLSCGINLYLEAAKNNVTTDTPTTDPSGSTPTTDPSSGVTTTAEPETSFVDVTDDKGNVVTDEKGNKVTQKVTVKPSGTKKPTTGASTGGNAAQTFDIGIAVALGALATSGIGIVASKKRK